MLDLADAGGVAAACGAWRRDGNSIALVPTMGNLHAGHLALVDRARALAERVVVSLYVNPTQFGANEDLASYPRTPVEDLAALRAAGVDLVYRPAEAEIYPRGPARAFGVRVPSAYADTLCGTFRPGHFDGVASVVLRLLLQVRPDVAVFGEKDYQQLLVIRRLVADLRLAVDIEGVPVIREPDGLAMSSRNRYLTAAQRRQAPALYRALVAAADALAAGQVPDEVSRRGVETIAAAGLRPQYFEVRGADDLVPAPAAGQALRVLVAAHAGTTRLIDNIAVPPHPRALANGVDVTEN